MYLLKLLLHHVFHFLEIWGYHWSTLVPSQWVNAQDCLAPRRKGNYFHNGTHLSTSLGSPLVGTSRKNSPIITTLRSSPLPLGWSWVRYSSLSLTLGTPCRPFSNSQQLLLCTSSSAFQPPGAYSLLSSQRWQGNRARHWRLDLKNCWVLFSDTWTASILVCHSGLSSLCRSHLYHLQQEGPSCFRREVRPGEGGQRTGAFLPAQSISGESSC